VSLGFDTPGWQDAAVKTIRIRNVPDAVYRTLCAHAEAAGVSLGEFALAELERVRERPPVGEVLQRARARAGGADRAAIVAAVRDGRGRD
jgi:hypothetical protein